MYSQETRQHGSLGACSLKSADNTSLFNPIRIPEDSAYLNIPTSLKMRLVFIPTRQLFL